jgi:hypothetical protein
MLRFRTLEAKARADARQEAAQRTRAINRMAGPAVSARDDARPVGRLLLDIGSQTIDLELRPDPRDVRRWRAYRNGEPYLHAGLERIWRKVQSEIAPPLGRDRWSEA